MGSDLHLAPFDHILPTHPSIINGFPLFFHLYWHFFSFQGVLLAPGKIPSTESEKADVPPSHKIGGFQWSGVRRGVLFRGHWGISGDIFDCHRVGEWGTWQCHYWHLMIREAARHPTVRRAPPQPSVIQPIMSTEPRLKSLLWILML